MAKFGNLRKLTTEDFNGQEWAQKLIVPFNMLIDAIQAALNRALTLGENMSAKLVEVEIDGTYPVKLAWDLPAKPVSVLVGDVYRSDGTDMTLTEAVFVQWSYNQNGQLQIDNAVGFPDPASPSVKYKLNLEVKTG